MSNVTTPDGTAVKAKPKPAPKKAVAKPAGTPGGISAADWRQVQAVARAHGVDPYLLVAIGVHETQWGTQGAGRPVSQGGASNILGYGAFDTNPNNPQYSGLTSQLNGAASLLASHGVHNINDLVAYQNAHGANVYGATDKGWTGGVASAYASIKGGAKVPALTSISNSAKAGTLTEGAAAAGDSVTDYADANYGYLGAFIHDPVVGPILRQAAKDGWDNATLLGALYKTPWWQHTSDTARQFDAEGKIDPAAHAQKITNQTAQILGLAKQDGFALDPNRAKQLAINSLRLGWSDSQIKQGVASEYKYNPANAQNATVAQLKKDAYDYAIPLSDSTIQQWATNIMAGKAQASDFTAYAQTQAKSLYPTISAALDGMTTRQYYDPYANIASKELNIPADSIDLSDPKWQKALMQTEPDGTRRAMTLDDWTKTIRNDPAFGWDNTPQAIKAGADVGAQLTNALGF